MLKLTNLGGMGMAAAGLGKSNLALKKCMRRVPAHGKLHTAWGRAEVIFC